MITSIEAFFADFSFTSYMGLLLYWLPFSICLYGYTVRTIINYRLDLVERDKVRREEKRTYYPTDTIGTLIGRAVVTTVPVANLWAAAFDVSPKLLGSFFNWLGKVFDQPLVPK